MLFKRFKKIIKWVLIVFAILGLLLVALAAVLHWYFPDSQVKRLLIRQAYAATGRSVEIDTLQVRIFGGIRVQGIRVGFTPEEGMASGYFLEADEASLNYSLLPLLRKQIDITGIRLIRPQVRVVVPQTQKDTTAAQQAAVLTELPLTIQLDRFQLDDASVWASVPAPEGIQTFSVSNLNLSLQDLYIPRKWMEEQNRIRVQGSFVMEDTRLDVKLPAMAFAVKPKVKLDFGWNGRGEWGVDGQLSVAHAAMHEKLVEVKMAVRGKGFGETISIETFDLNLFGQRALTCQATVRDAGPDLSFEMSYSGAPLNLESVKESSEQLLKVVGFEQPIINQTTLSGTLNPGKGRISGRPDSLELEINPAFSGIDVMNDSLGLMARNGRGSLTLTGTWTLLHGMKSGNVASRFDLSEFIFSPIQDTLVSLQTVRFKLNSDLDATFFPKYGDVELKVARVLGSPFHFNLNWDGFSFSNETLTGRFDGNLKASALQLDALPNLSIPLHGNVMIDGRLSGVRPDSIALSLDASTNGIEYVLGEVDEKLPAMQLTSSWLLGVDPVRKQIILHTSRLQLDSLFEASAHGLFQTDSLNADFAANARLRNAAINELIPVQITDELGAIRLIGEERVAGRVHMNLNNPDDIRIHAQCDLNGVGYEMPALDLFFAEGQGKVLLSGPLNQLDYEGDFELGQAELLLVRTEPFRSLSLDFKGNIVDLTRIELERAHVSIPDLGVKARAEGAFRVETPLPYMQFSGLVQLNAADSIRMMDDLWLGGKAAVRFSGETIHSNSQLDVSAYATLNAIKLKHALGFQVEGIDAALPVSLALDLEKGMLISDSDIAPLAKTAFQVNADLYRSLYKNLGWLKIKSANYLQYTLAGAYLDVRVAQGLIDIPLVEMKLLGGNLGGSAFLNLAGGDPAQMTYGIRLQGARINSAAFQEKGQAEDEETEINATLAFEGKGVDIRQTIDLDGAFHITQIGSNFASTLLLQMDPKGVDRNIRMTRKLLGMGYQPKLFSFELRHGYVYPSLKLDQPWFSPIRIPEEINYGRLPLEFFLKNTSFSK